jgi:hypothetical protein
MRHQRHGFGSTAAIARHRATISAATRTDTSAIASKVSGRGRVTSPLSINPLAIFPAILASVVS